MGWKRVFVALLLVGLVLVLFIYSPLLYSRLFESTPPRQPAWLQEDLAALVQRRYGHEGELVDTDVLADLKVMGLEYENMYIASLDHSDWAVRAGAAYMLGEIETRDPQARLLLVAMSAEAGPEQHYVLHALTALDPLFAGDHELLRNGEAEPGAYRTAEFAALVTAQLAWRNDLLAAWDAGHDRQQVLGELLFALGSRHCLDPALADYALDLIGVEAAAEYAFLFTVLEEGSSLSRDREYSHQAKRRAAELLSLSGPPAVLGLSRLAGGQDEQAAGLALDALTGMTGTDLSGIAAQMVELALRDQTQVGIRAKKVIGMTGPQAFPDILPHLDSQDPTVLEEAISLLGSASGNAGLKPYEYRDTPELNELLPLLYSFLDHPETDVLTATFFSLSYTRPTPAEAPRRIFDTLKQHRESERYPWMIGCAFSSIVNMRPIPPDIVDWFADQVVNHKSPKERQHCAGDLGSMGAEAERALPVLEQAVSETDDEDLRRIAQLAIDRINEDLARQRLSPGSVAEN